LARQKMPRDVWHQTFADQVQQALHEAYGNEIPGYLEEIACSVGVRNSSPRRTGPQAGSPRSLASARKEKAAALNQLPRSDSGHRVGHRLYEEGIALRERRKAFMDEVMNLQQAELKNKAKELLSRGSRLYPSIRSMGSKEDRKERRYPGRICGVSRSPERSARRSQSPKSPKSPKSEAKVESSQTISTQASSVASPSVESTELELLKKQLGLLSMGAEMLLKKLEAVSDTPDPEGTLGASVEVDASPQSVEEPHPSPSRSPSIRRAGGAKVGFAQMMPFEQGLEPVTPVNAWHQLGSSSAPSPVWGQVDYNALGTYGRCSPVVTVNSFVQVHPNHPVTQRVPMVQGLSPQ